VRLRVQKQYLFSHEEYVHPPQEAAVQFSPVFAEYPEPLVVKIHELLHEKNQE